VLPELNSHVGGWIMKISVELMAFIRRPDGLPRVFDREIGEPIAISKFLRSLDFSIQEIRMMQFFISKTSDKDNNERVQRSYTLKDGDHLFITLPIGGG
jgi:hypothetical protein